MQLLTDRLWRDVLREQSDAARRRRRDTVVLLNPPRDVYTLLAAIGPRDAPAHRSYYGVRVDVLAADTVECLYVWHVDCNVASVATQLCGFLQSQRERFDDNVLVLCFLDSVQTMDKVLAFYQTLMRRLAESSVHSQNQQIFMDLMQRAKDHERYVDIDNIIPSLVVNRVTDAGLRQQQRVRAAAAEFYASVINSGQQDRLDKNALFRFYLLPQQAIPDAKELRQEGCIVSGQDYKEAIEKLLEDIPEPQGYGVPSDVPALQSEQPTLQEVYSSFCEQLDQVQLQKAVQFVPQGKQSDSQAPKFGSRFKQGARKKVFQ